MRRRQETESIAKDETNRIVEEAKEKEKAQSLVLQELKQEKTKMEDTIYRLKRCVQILLLRITWYMDHMISCTVQVQCRR